MSKYARLFNGDSAPAADPPLNRLVSSTPPRVGGGEGPGESKTFRRLVRRRGREGGAGEGAPPTDAAEALAAPPDDDNPANSAAADDDDDDDDDGLGEEAKEEAEEEEEEEGERAGRGRVFSCDLCPHLGFPSAEALEGHALETHAELLRDYASLRPLVARLAPLWGALLARKAARVGGWGRKVFDVARERDAGPAKMAEAERARGQLEKVVRCWHPTAEVFIFGSSVAFAAWDSVSDIDFTVVDVKAFEAGVWPPPEKSAVRAITELLRRAGFSFVNLEPISHARVPIIKHHASSPIRVSRESAANESNAAKQEGGGEEEKKKKKAAAGSGASSRLETEDIISRSVRCALTQPASHADRAMLEGGIRASIGAEAVQQIWWNRTSDMMCFTCDTTTHAIQAAMCELTLASPSLRARMQPLHEECRPELYNVDFDLSFRAFGIRNSELLRRYLLSHPCGRPGAIVLKDWSKTSGVNNSVNGYLTSYAINIMWIYFLVQRGVVEYVDPIVDIPESLTNYQEELSKGPRYRPMLNPAWSAEEKAAYEWEAGRLLMEFFLYYAYEFDWANHVVSLNRKGITTKKMLGWDTEDIALPAAAAHLNGRRGGNPTRYSFCIEDPYEENLNLGRHMGITKSLRVRTEFCRALLSLCKDGESESCVFASTDRRGAAAAAPSTNTSSSSPSSSPLLPSPPGKLPFKVLYRLMAVCTREMALARERQASNSPPRSDPDGAETTAEVGVIEEDLQRAFETAAPLEFKLASKAWNWQQLIHRLGWKIHRGVVLPRREIGAKRRLASPPPWGVLPAPSLVGGGAEEASSSSTRELNARTDDAAGGLANAMSEALSEGFLRLTPEWVAWSTPWAPLHLRRLPFITPPHTHVNDTGESTIGSSTAESAEEKKKKKACEKASNPTIGNTFATGGGAGLLKNTPRNAARWKPPTSSALVPLALAPSLKKGFRMARLIRELFHR